MANEIKKFLDQAGVGVLWGKITEKVNAVNTKAEDNAKAIAQNKTDIGVNAAAIAQNKADIATNKAAHEANLAAINAIKDGASMDSFLDVEQAFAAVATDYATKVYADNAVAVEAGRAQGEEAKLAGRIKAVEDDYLKAADKTDLQGKIDGVSGRVATIEGDYLKAADKTALQNAIDLKADKTALEAEVSRAKEEEGKINAAIALLVDSTEDGEKLNSIKELAAWIEEHGGDAAEMAEAIGVNAAGIAAIRGELDGSEDADGIYDRLGAIETMLGDGEGSVADQIADAKKEAIDAAALDATGKANTAESNAKTYADGLNTAMDARVDALEAIDHEHANKDVIDGITSAKVVAWDDAVTKAHTHTNKDVIDGITAAKVSAWDAAEANAKAYADGLGVKYDAAGSAAQALVDAKAYADGLAGNYDVKGAAAQALVDAKAYTDTEFAKIQSLSEAEILAVCV